EGTNIRAAHIHRGAAGTNGPVVIPFQVDAAGVSDDCVTAEPPLVNEIQQNPEAFYVNVHTERYPDGAIRGQLMR
ncbi:MAG: CHRD domain-containing protein, partial [Actinomycetota bacterium]|nr:CHRD domain-containing protein [Actinomycetota bacterium]